MTEARTLFEKIWEDHVVHSPLQESARKDALAEAGLGDDAGLLGERQDLLYIDLHLIHEVTSPQAFEGLRRAGRAVRRPNLTLGTVDHNVPTIGRDLPNPDPLSAQQIEVMRRNAEEFGVTLYDIFDVRQGIVHIIGPEQGFTQPGM
ncbi:MAG: aconitase family protein, partial [Acidimicrobiia bacterium]